MPTKHELRTFLEEIKNAYGLICVGATPEFANGVVTIIQVIENEFDLNELGTRKDDNI